MRDSRPLASRTALRKALPILLAAIMLIASVGMADAKPGRGSSESGAITPRAGPLQINSFSYNPSTLSQGTSTQGSIQLSGGTPPYYAWLNNTAPGCQPPSVPYITSNTSNSFSCNPSAPGTFNVHLDVVDSAHPAGHATQSTTLTVNSNSNGNNNSGSGNGNNGKGSNGSFSLPSGLLYLATIFAFVFLGALVALAAGVIATAAFVSRRLRQLNETLAAQQKPAPVTKPPP